MGAPRTALAGGDEPQLSGTRRTIEMIRRANAPLPPEESVPLRVVTTLAVLAGLGACQSVGELSPASALGAGMAIVVGMVFSYLTRRRPWPFVKIILAVAVCAVFVHFVATVLADHGADLASVEIPLAELFAWIQITHAFDVPARRDLLFSLAASAAFVAIASAQAVESSFIDYVGIWLVLCVAALVMSWQSMLGARGRSLVGTMAGASGLAGVLALILVIALPAPQTSSLLTLPFSSHSSLALPNQGGLSGGNSGTQPSTPAKATGPLGVGGFNGFAGPLDTALRGALGDQVVMQVRATRPGYFVALTYDDWDGTSWLDTTTSHLRTFNSGSPFLVGDGGGPQDIQTFHVEVPLTNVLVAAANPVQVWFPARTLYEDPADSSIRSSVAVTPGTVYTVVSDDTQAAPSVLARDRAPLSEFERDAPKDLQLPYAYPAVTALAERITAHARTVYAKIVALEAWMSANVRYSTDIPALLPGQDAVNQFLFHGRIGYCEQISSATAVMLRTLGIPAREVTGYVPGPFNALTGLDEIQAKDAHAWIQVDFPGLGWQSFDPTADVPLANPDPGALIASALWRDAKQVPLPPVAGGGAALAALACLLAWRRRPRTWAERATRRLERAASARGIRRGVGETLAEYAARLGSPAPPGDDVIASVAIIERAAYGGTEAGDAERRQVAAMTRALRRRRRVRRPAPPARRPLPVAR